MGIQGKGIFGGFSGKVGTVQGMRKYKSDTMQSLPKFKTRDNNLNPTYDLMQMESKVGAVAGLGYCENGTGTNSRLNTALGLETLDNKVGGFTWTKSGVNSTYYACFDDEYKGTTEGNYQLYFYMLSFLTRIRVDGVVVYSGAGQKMGEIFSLRWISGELWFMRDDLTGVLEKTLQINGYNRDKIALTFIMFAAGTIASGINVGKASGQYIL